MAAHTIAYTYYGYTYYGYTCSYTYSYSYTYSPTYTYTYTYSHPHPYQVGITQPRRVAAVAMAQRVAYELGDTLGGRVAYQVTTYPLTP